MATAQAWLKTLTHSYASFFKGHGHPGIFSLVKGQLYTAEHFKGIKPMTLEPCCVNELKITQYI